MTETTEGDKAMVEKAITFRLYRELVSTFVATLLAFGMLFADKFKEDFFIPFAGATVVVAIESLRQLAAQLREIDKRNRM